MKNFFISAFIICLCLIFCSCSIIGFSSLSLDDITSNVYIVNENGEKTKPYTRIVGGHYRNSSGDWVTDDTLMFGTENAVEGVLESSENALPKIYADNGFKLMYGGKEYTAKIELFDMSGDFIGSYSIADISEISSGTYVAFALISDVDGNFADGMQEYYDIGIFFKIVAR